VVYKECVIKTNFAGLKLFKRGKVRDIYDLGNRLLIVATDRISAFDVVLPNGIPYKGKVLTQISKFWFDQLKEIVPTHFITMDVDEYPQECRIYKDILKGRSMIVEKSEPLPIECVVRGYLSGSGFSEYKERGSICGIPLPKNLLESSKLDEPIFTPSTKSDKGHDENIPFGRVNEILGRDLAEKLRDLSLTIYKKASEIAEKKGIIIADTKFEFGMLGGKLALIDEVLTPDSSRFWLKDDYRPGRVQKSFDKQFVRDYLLTLDWDRTPPAPELPEEVVKKTTEKYLEALERLTDITLR